ncbi:MAG: hypothetical protein ACLVAU_13440 [Ruminococcus sp.]
MSELGFSGGKILEPAAGVGNFIGCAPENIADRSFFTAVEIDSISGRIAKQLYPESKFRCVAMKTQSSEQARSMWQSAMFLSVIIV